LKPRIAVVGAGAFGRNHLRVIHGSERAELAGVFDLDRECAAQAAEPYGCAVFESMEELGRSPNAAVVATPTVTHSEAGCALLEMGLDVMVEKPIAHTPAAARELVAAALRRGRILQAGHLERFNPAVIALEAAIGKPLIYQLARATIRRRSAAEAASFEALRDNIHFRRTMTLMTLVWGFGLLTQTALACLLVFTLTIHDYLLVSPVVGYGLVGALSLWTFWYARRARRRGEARRAAEEAAKAGLDAGGA